MKWKMDDRGLSELPELIGRAIRKGVSGFRAQPFEDAYVMSKKLMEAEERMPVGLPIGMTPWRRRGIKGLRLLSKAIEMRMPGMEDPKEIVRLFDLHKRVLLAAAPYDFQSYLLYTEWERQQDQKFYPRRRKALEGIVDAMQRLEDDETDLLTISLPPGTGKSTLALFYLTWIGGRHPEKPMLGGSHSNSFLRGAYDECLRMMEPGGEYLWKNVFRGTEIVSTNAKDMRIDLNTGKRFETFEFSSIGSGNAGKVRAQSLLYCDDLVSDIEQALSKERMDKLWEQYTTDLRQRKIGACKELHIATRWSVNDVIGRLERAYEGSERAEFIVIPAMNERDESNFDYGGDVGFTTKMYREQRDIMDSASWKALFMNEPIEREGLLYSEDELRRYFDLPEGDPDGIIGVCDTKDRGKDYAFLPVAYVYGEDYYIVDCVCNNGLPNVVDALMVDVLCRNKVQMCRYESNSAGGRVAQKVQEEVKKRGGITRITTKYTTANKETKIIVNSPWVKEHCLFKDRSKYAKGSEYWRMISFLCSYTVAGRNAHDDVPDGFAQLAEYAQSFGTAKVSVMRRVF